MALLRPEQLVLTVPAPAAGRDETLETLARQLLREIGAGELARRVKVQWNPRLRSAAGRAYLRESVVSLNPLLARHGADEIDRTLRHELAHLLAQTRAGRRRIAPHGPEWRLACRHLGIGGEARCHALPLPTIRQQRRYLYECPVCRRQFPRVRPLRRPAACRACCRRFNRGKFHVTFRLAIR